MIERTAPFVASKKSECGDWRCRRLVERGDVCVRYSDAPDGLPAHIEHWLKERENELGRALRDVTRCRTVAERVLNFCAGLSAVNAEWIAEQFRELADWRG